MKAYTNLEQSKKLAEMLSLDSADMSYTLDFNSEKYYISTTSYKSWVVPKYAESYKGLNQVIPCWSASALLEVIRNNGRYELQMYEGGYYFEANGFMTESYFNVVDVCVEMILELKERDLL